MPDTVSSERFLPLFAFEEVGSDLELVPLAARRALDHAGLKLSLEGWRSLNLDDKKNLMLAGVPDIVDAPMVEANASRATPPATTIEREPDPDPVSLPAEISESALSLQQWALLRPIDRYALVRASKSAAKRGDPTIFEAALTAVLNASRQRGGVPSSAPSSVSPTLPEYALTQEPAVPARPTEPPAWSAPVALPLEDSQPGLTSSTGAPPRIVAPDGGGDTPVRPRTTMLSVSDESRSSRGSPSSRGAPSVSLSSHLDASGAARMVDISEKSPTLRRAVATGTVQMLPATAMRVMRADAPKGEVIGAARIAGIMAAKRTSELIPLCHVVALTHVGVDIQVRVDADVAEARVTATTEALDRTGVEMEAMVAVSVACLTIYDMLKGIDRAMTISDVKLLEKSGGRSGYFRREPPA